MLRKLPLVLAAFIALNVTSYTNVSAQDNNTITADSLNIMIGQMIMIGIGDRVEVHKKDSLLQDIREGKIGGVILFEKNIHKKKPIEKLKEMLDKFHETAPQKLFVAIDEEGGKVHRLKEKYGFVGMPSAAYLGELDNLDSTYYYNDVLSAQLKDLGFNVNFAPSVDLAVNDSNDVIVRKNRSFGADPAKVERHALACMAAHEKNKVLTVLKHFPGHGSSTGDSHWGMVDVAKTWTMKEIYPYNNIIEKGKCKAIMSAHIINQRWDTAGLPGTLSYQVLNIFLRGYMRYDGMIFSDDMQMKAISAQYGLEQALAMGINAGLDMVVFGNNVVASDRPLSGKEIHSIIRKLVYENNIPVSRIREAYGRIMKVKEGL